MSRRVSKRARAWAVARGAPECARAVVAALSSGPRAAFSGAGCPLPSPSQLRGASASRRLCGPLPPGTDLARVYVSGDSGGWLPFSVLHEGRGGTGRIRSHCAVGFGSRGLQVQASMRRHLVFSESLCHGKITETSCLGSESRHLVLQVSVLRAQCFSPCLCGGRGSSGGRPVDGAGALVRSLGTR